MTTIAINMNEGVIAYDSRATAGDRIASDNINKRRTYAGYNFFYAGSLIDIDKLIQLFFDEDAPIRKRKDGDLNACMYVVSPEKEVYVCAYEDDELIVQNIDHRDYDALGSGYQYAIGAMHAGASAKDAVKIATKNDMFSGGRIRTFKI